MKKPGPKPRPLIERFWSKVEKTERCWLWRGSIGNGGYGIISDAVTLPNGRRASFSVRASHVAYRLAYGVPVPPGVFVLHSCDTPSCVRSDHLRLGSAQDNVDDMRARDRMARGSRRGHAKLTESLVEILRQEYVSDRSSTYEKLAIKYGATRAAIAGAISGKTWSHVPGAVGPHRFKRRVLTEDQVRSVYRRYVEDDERLPAIAKSLNVSVSTVYNILSGIVWKGTFQACGFTHSLVERKRPARWGKVTPDQVINIRTSYSGGGITLFTLAREYGVTEACIHRIIHRKSWADIR